MNFLPILSEMCIANIYQYCIIVAIKNMHILAKSNQSIYAENENLSNVFGVFY